MSEEAETVLRRDPVMAELVEQYDPYTEREWEEYERLAVSIVTQQLSTASAMAVRERVFDLLGEVAPETVLAAEEAALREAGLSNSKVEYLRTTAEAFRREDFTREGLADLSNDEVIDRLTAIRGVGPWTARMYLMFVLERPDVLPLGDLAVRRGIETLYADGESMTRQEMREAAEAWRPYRSYGTRYIWAAYEDD
jgi:DNA-3-methyladenine glycosylase II